MAEPFEPCLVQVDRALGLSFLCERLIELWSVPMRIGDLVMRARRHQQLPLMIGVVRKCGARLVEEKREPALQAAGDVRTRALPRAPLGERPNPRQIVAVGELLEQEIGERCRGFPDGESRVAAPLDEHDAPPSFDQRERSERPGEARSHDRDVGMDAGNRGKAVTHCPWP